MRHLIIFLSIALLGNAGAAVIYVDADATAGGDGSSWASAFNYLQDALDQTVASQGDEVWIAEGTYFPDDGASVTDGDRAASFTLKDDVALYGGFVGTETSLVERDWDTYVTTLSGKIFTEQIYWSLHVCTIVANASVAFDGLTVTGGNANGTGTGEDQAGAVFCSSYFQVDQVAAVNCTFSENSAISGGVAYYGSWTVTNSTFSGNSASSGGVAFGGTWAVANSTFSGNSASSGGVASLSMWTVTNSTFSGNSASSGGSVASLGTWTVTNSTFSGNSAWDGGVASLGTWTVTNSIFDATNSDQNGYIFKRLSGFKNTTASAPSPSSPRAINLIQGGLAAIDASLIDLGTGFLLDADPLFVNASDPDGADNIWGTADDGLRLQADSPALGQGNTDFLPQDTLDVDDDGVTVEPLPIDFAGYKRIQDITLDLGAYEYGNVIAAAAFVTIDPISKSTVSGGESYDITVISNTDWTVTESLDWASVSLATGSADGTVTVTVDENTVMGARSGTISIGGELHTLVQDGTDTDSDGLLDSYEQTIIDADLGDAIDGLDDVLPGDDFDEDGRTNLEEQNEETDPTDADSYTPPQEARWEPAGWVYYAWPYAYDFTQGRWHFFNQSDKQWRVNLTNSQWATLDAATGWNYYAWPYSYSSDQGAWHWYNANIQWVFDLASGEWELFGGSD